MQGTVPQLTPFSTLLGRPNKPEGRLKKYQWTNKCKWSVSILSVNAHGKFALKFEVRKFNNESLHSSGVKLPLDENLANVHSRCSLSSPFIIHEGLKFLVKLIYI